MQLGLWSIPVIDCSLVLEFALSSSPLPRLMRRSGAFFRFEYPLRNDADLASPSKDNSSISRGLTPGETSAAPAHTAATEFPY